MTYLRFTRKQAKAVWQRDSQETFNHEILFPKVNSTRPVRAKSFDYTLMQRSFCLAGRDVFGAFRPFLYFGTLFVSPLAKQ